MPQLSARSAVMPSINNQAERLITLGLPAAITDETLRRAAARLRNVSARGSLACAPRTCRSASDLAPLMSLPAPGEWARQENVGRIRCY